jgi:hypothetical protein
MPCIPRAETSRIEPPLARTTLRFEGRRRTLETRFGLLLIQVEAEI